MINLTDFIYEDGNRFYLDLEKYDEGGSIYLDKSLRFGHGDSIKWLWEGKKMFGTLKELGQNGELFIIDNVSSS